MSNYFAALALPASSGTGSFPVLSVNYFKIIFQNNNNEVTPELEHQLLFLILISYSSSDDLNSGIFNII